MDFTKRVLLGVCFVALLTAAVRVKARTTEDAGRKEIEAFNKRYVELNLKMEFHDIQVRGDWASEWATEHQVVQPPEGKPPIESYGKIALVLHREANGEWKVQQEMWNGSPKPG